MNHDHDEELDESGSDWGDSDWPEDWADWAENYDWEVFDLDISISYGGE